MRTELPHQPSNQEGSTWPRVTARIVPRQEAQEAQYETSSIRTERRGPNRTIGAEPQYRLIPQWTLSVHPPPRRASTATCSRGLIDDSRRFARARSRRSMPVSPTTGNGNSCGARPLPDTTSRYLVGFAARISTRRGYRPLTSNSARTDRAHRNVRAIGAYPDTQGDVCEERIVTRGTCR